MNDVTTGQLLRVTRRNSLIYRLQNELKALDKNHPMYPTRRRFLLRLLGQLSVGKTQGRFS